MSSFGLCAHARMHNHTGGRTCKHNTHTNGHISKLYYRNLLQQINAALERLVKEEENPSREVGLKR